MSVRLHTCNYYEVLWYEPDAYTGEKNFYLSREFRTRNAAMNFYNQHKGDVDKCDWWVTKRDKDDNVIEDIIY